MKILSWPDLLPGAGIALAISGIIALMAGQPDHTFIIIKLIGILHLVAGVFTAYYAGLNPQLRFGAKLLSVRAVSGLLFGGVLTLAVTALEDFLLATAAYALFTAFFEVLFSSGVATFRRFNRFAVSFTLLNSLLNGIAGVVILMSLHSSFNPLPVVATQMIGAGVLAWGFWRVSDGMTPGPGPANL